MPTTASCSAQTHSALSDIDLRKRYLQPFGELPTDVVSPGAGAEGRYRLSLSGSAPLRRPASRYGGYWRAPIGSSRRRGLRLDPRAA
jgi:hypothetical protein